MSASARPDNVTPREAAAALVRGMRPLSPGEARAIAGPIAAAMARMEQGNAQAAPGVVASPDAIPGRIHARPLRRDAPLGRGAPLHRPRALVTRPGPSPAAAGPRTVSGVERAR
jgi:hypothetical protein